jgi:D-glycero-D-manno-heptose 1,7-bisphosphate phosphatase
VPPKLPGNLPRDIRTVFLDRDGVLNEKMPEGRYVASWDEFHILPGVPEAIARLNRAGKRVVVVSNQRGIALGLYTAADVQSIHEAFLRELNAYGAQIDGFFMCPHDHEACNCRKPLPGLFEQAAACFPDVAADTSIMVGDSLVDMEFGRNLGMATILIDVDPARHKPGNSSAAKLADLRFPSLSQAVDAILAASDRTGS